MFPFVEEFSSWHNNEFGTTVSAQDFHSYEFDQVLGISIPDTVERIHAFLELDHKHLGVGPIDQAQEAVQQLARQYELIVVTARHPGFRTMTEEYLDTYFAGCFSEVVTVGHEATMDIVRSKASVCQEIGAVTLIDDSVGHVTACAAVGIPGVLFGDYTWNQVGDGLLPELVTRCKDWPAVLEHLNG